MRSPPRPLAPEGGALKRCEARRKSGFWSDPCFYDTGLSNETMVLRVNPKRHADKMLGVIQSERDRALERVIDQLADAPREIELPVRLWESLHPDVLGRFIGSGRDGTFVREAGPGTLGNTLKSCSGSMSCSVPAAPRFLGASFFSGFQKKNYLMRIAKNPVGVR